MTYTELLTKIRDYTEVDSNVFTSTIVDGFLSDAEFRILRDVDSDNNRQYAQADIVNGQRYVNTPLINNQTLVIRSAQITDSTGGADNSNRSFLEYRDTNYISEYNSTGVLGLPKYYSYWDENTIVIAPTPDQNYNMQINYILKPDGLSSTNTTTYLSTEFPNGLLYACLVEAYGFLKGPADMIQFYEGKYKQALEGFTVEQMGRRRRDEYTDGSPRLPKQ
tara:strand:- start:779 stop:1441 length:663 start_codon:yes stop_codon:yes gene_type:complete